MTNINYWGAVGAAWNRMKTILFHPFNMEKWFIMGFAAWIAGLNSGGGGGGGGGGRNSFNFSNPASGGTGHGSGGSEFAHFWGQYGPLVIMGSAIILIVVLVLGIAFAWLHARGKFIFLDNVLCNRGAIAEPWKKYRMQGNSLFFWNLAIGCIGLVFFLFCVALCLPLIIPLASGGEAAAVGVLGLAVAILLLIIYSIVMSFVQMLVYDFVMPLMLKYDLRIREAWRRFSNILRPAFGKFVLYALVRFLLSIIISTVLMVAFLATCCCLLILAAIPYLGTVLMLPVFVFVRLVGIEFLKQFGEDFEEAPEETVDGLLSLP